MVEWNGPLLAVAGAVLLVCTRCNRTGADEQQTGMCSGSRLLHEVHGRPPDPAVRIQPIACISGCNRACAIGLMAPDKVGYVFGDLSPDASAAQAIAEVAAAYAASPDGFLPRAARPPLLQSGILARLPPLTWARSDEITWPL
jgi:predicted metal-binding protein